MSNEKELAACEEAALLHQAILREFYGTEEDDQAQPPRDLLLEELETVRQDRDAAVALIEAVEDELLAIRIHAGRIDQLLRSWDTGHGSTAQERREKQLNRLTKQETRE